MGKIFRYECGRLMGNRIFWGLLAVTLWYARQTLFGEVLLGVANTAPFSPWSFGYYLSRLAPFLCAAELFFLTFFTSDAARRTGVLTDASPVDPRNYALARCGAVLLGMALLILCVLALAAGFYGKLFRWNAFASLIVPALAALLPPLAFCLGAGWRLGRIHPLLVWVVLAAVFLLPYTPLPDGGQLTLEAFFMAYPKTLSVLDPAFSLPAPVLVGRVVITALGVLLFACAVRPAKRTI